MANVNKQLLAFFKSEVALTEATKSDMRNRRRSCEERLERGLERNEDPEVDRFVKQGSYAMHTMVQSNSITSDIDNGVVFHEDKLVGDRGGKFSAYDAKCMVRDALNYDKAFEREPEVLKNCVRVFYKDGFTIDMPVYREIGNGDDAKYELAAADWKHSDPEAVTEWFQNNVTQKSPDTVDGRQMRRMVRLLKAWSKSRASWSLPSGFVLSILTNEVYPHGGYPDREDLALFQTVQKMRNRLLWNLTVSRPVPEYENVTKSNSDANMVSLRDKLNEAVDRLAPLADAHAADLEALKALKWFFCTEYFDEEIESLEEAAKASAKFVSTESRQPSGPVVKSGGEGRYA
ncbi:TPA: hypothetical protein QDB08_002693 [Burkholderia vietnamiensis]|uniref:cyclic GMP-AMP synthase DncV-like nucleotidyltransferase n=1 Tax=Burkholderia vietnamiensis TaxID=60552 RepID=UPI0015946E6B|nr:hypothetical protein [Burkholderia vietnamiensis]HDR9009723.1 hypothetical protein [Burkholderia vietnamiensis]HDR9013768.1 hypothetical protein [Burkholderia vietnamiensis]